MLISLLLIASLGGFIAVVLVTRRQKRLMLRGVPNAEWIAMRDAMVPRAGPEVREQLTYLLAAVMTHANPVRQQMRKSDRDSNNLESMTLLGLGQALNGFGFEANEKHLTSARKVFYAFETQFAVEYGANGRGASPDEVLKTVIAPAAAYLSIQVGLFGRRADVLEFINNGFSGTPSVS